MRSSKEHSSLHVINQSVNDLTAEEAFSVFYHNIFDYPLDYSEIVRWTPQKPPKKHIKIDFKNGFYFISGREGLIYKREVRKRHSRKKIKIAEKASKIMSHIPFIKMVGITGSVAMNNATEDSDIDLIVITEQGRLWTSRLIVYILLNLLGFGLRIPKKIVQKDKLCLNIWLDENNLTWKKERNYYTAHEILQVKPLINKDNMYEHWLFKNRWALKFWPNAIGDKKLIKIKATYSKPNNNFITVFKKTPGVSPCDELDADMSSSLTGNPVRENGQGVIEKNTYKAQLWYMQKKMTREIVNPGYAFFHPNNLSKTIVKKYS